MSAIDDNTSVARIAIPSDVFSAPSRSYLVYFSNRSRIRIVNDNIVVTTKSIGMRYLLKFLVFMAARTPMIVFGLRVQYFFFMDVCKFFFSSFTRLDDDTFFDNINFSYSCNTS